MRHARKGFRRRAFVDGLVMGLAAPALLFAGAFEAPLQTRRSSLEGSWHRVGSHIRTAMSEYRDNGRTR